MRRVQFVVILLLAFPSAIDAAPIRWDLRDVRFNDGTTATGYFVLDVDREGRLKHIKTGDYSITAAPDAVFTGATYEAGSSTQSAKAIFRLYSNVVDSQMFLFVLKAPLTDRGGVVEILRVDELQPSGIQMRSIATGSLVGTPVASIPEPTTLALLGIGAIALRRRFTR